MSDPSRYTANIDLRNVNDSHTFAVAAVPARSTVLDVGAADGSMARTLRQLDCRVWGVEFDPNAAALARNWCEEVAEGDVEQLNFTSTFGRKFDVILFLDVLEHVKDPLSVLRNALTVLEDSGHVVISLPNVAHAAMRAQLLSGRFSYTEVGLLDQTHLRFFDPVSVRQFLRDAGLVVLDEARVTFPIDGTEIAVDVDRLDPLVLEKMQEGEEAESYQFLFVAAPAGSSAAQEPTLLPARTLQRELRAAREQIAVLEGASGVRGLLDRHAMAEQLQGLLNANRDRRRALANLLHSFNENTLQ
jgi:2-polyprenyl-3-methyl-5-hydroxy-6-metoxy-1,4-benzoquinol methylase